MSESKPLVLIKNSFRKSSGTSPNKNESTQSVTLWTLILDSNQPINSTISTNRKRYWLAQNSILVDLLESLLRPVSPVDVRSDLRQIEWINVRGLEDNSPVGAVLAAALDALGLRIAPADLLTLMVVVDAVRHAQIGADENFSLCAVHVRALNSWRLAVPIDRQISHKQRK